MNRAVSKMKYDAGRGRAVLTALAALCAVSAWVCPLAVAEDPRVPYLVNYQGVLRDHQGNAASNGNYIVAFRLWDAPTGGNLLWGQAYPVHVMDGYFNVVLGFGGQNIAGAAYDNLPDALDEPNRYMGLTMHGGSEITPRQQLLSSPYALTAQRAELAAYAEHAAQADNASTAAVAVVALDADTVDGKEASAFLEKGAYPTDGSGGDDGIVFPLNPSGGSGDKAYLKYYNPDAWGEDLTLELGIENDLGDDIKLKASGDVDVRASRDVDIRGERNVDVHADGYIYLNPGNGNGDIRLRGKVLRKRNTVYEDYEYTAWKDCFLMIYAYRGKHNVRLKDSSGTVYFQDNFFHSSGGADTSFQCIPLMKGDKFYVTEENTSKLKMWTVNLGY